MRSGLLAAFAVGMLAVSTLVPAATGDVEDGTASTETLTLDAEALDAEAQAVVDAYPLPEAADNGLVLLLSTLPESGWPRSRSIESVAAALGASVDDMSGPPIESFPQFAARTYVDRDIRREMMEVVRSGPWSSKRYPEVAAWLAAQAEGLAVVEAALDRSEWVTPIWVADGKLGSTLMIDQRHGGAVADILLIAAHLAIEQQDAESAWRHIETGQRLAVRMSSGPFVVDKQRAALQSEALWGAVRTWCASRFLDAEQIDAALVTLLSDAWPHAGMAADLTRAEAPLVRSIINAAESGTPVDDLIETAVGDLSISEGVAYERWRTEADVIMNTLAERVDASSRTELNDALKEMVETRPPLTDEPDRLSEQLAALPAPDDTAYAEAATNLLIAYSARIIEQVRTARIAQLNHEANRRVAIMALAARRYQAATGAYPSKLEKLIPEFLPEAQAGLLVDPLSGGSLHYAPSEAGFRVNSVGIDGQNDLGRDDDPAIEFGRARRAA